MKLARPIAALAALTLAGFAGLGIAGSAIAATPGVTYVTAPDVGGEVAPFHPTGGWFTETGAPKTSGLSGLTIPPGTDLVDGFVTAPAIDTGTALEDLAATMAVQADLASQLSPVIYFYPPAPAVQFAFTMADAGADPTDPTIAWTSNEAPIGNIPAGTPATLAQFDAQLKIDPTFAGGTITAAGWVTGPHPTTFTSAAVAGTTSVFTPEPVVTAAPTTIAFADYTKAPGVVISTTGFLPNEVLDVYYGTPNGGGKIGTATADANGAITYTHFDGAATTGGAYSITLVGETASGNPQRFDFTVADPIAAAELAKTGVDASPYLAIAGGLLAVGVVLVLVMVFRRRGRHS